MALFIAAAFFEIFGCFAFWLRFRLHKSDYWLLPGVISLCLFAYILSKVQTEFAGRAYAIYGGIYIAASLLWMAVVERQTPDGWDFAGASLCILGACVILFSPR